MERTGIVLTELPQLYVTHIKELLISSSSFVVTGRYGTSTGTHTYVYFDLTCAIHHIFW